MYYLRSRPAADAIKFTLDVEMLLKDAGHIEIKNTPLKSIYNLPEKGNRTPLAEFEVESTKSKKVKGDDEPGTGKKKINLPMCTDPDNCLSCGS